MNRNITQQMDEKEMEMEKDNNFFAKLSFLKGKKGMDFILVIIIILAIIFIYFTTYASPSSSNEAEETPVDVSQVSSDTTDTEVRLSQVLSSIKGAGEVEVMITYESGAELVPAMNTQTDSTSQSQEDNGTTTDTQSTKSEMVTVESNGDSKALVVREDEPLVRGVVVIAQGAGEVSVRMELSQAVCTVLNIDQNKVEVFEMK